MTNEIEKAKHHGKAAKMFHWLTAGMLVYGYLTGVDDLAELSDPARFQTEIIFALLLGVAFLARFFWMQRINGHTRLPDNAAAWEQVGSKIAHYGIYIGVGLIVLSGLAIAFGYAIPALNGVFVSIMIGLHEVSLAATLILLLAHVIGAVWHKLVRNDGIWESMLPRRHRANTMHIND